ncbi:unnamed protein product [Closterium sp. NIES-64]|nr:unnamed protein product [Closterium sp. NIES-64]CAI5952049.1 unnamed protein product [Closterium sp. NIES-65]
MNAEIAAGKPTARPLRSVGAASSTPKQATVLPREYDTDDEYIEKDSDDEDDAAGSDRDDAVAAWHGIAEYNGPDQDDATAAQADHDQSAAASRPDGKRKGKSAVRSPAKVNSSPGPGARIEWTLKESTILVAARWFTKDELQQMTGKQGSQYWLRLCEHIKLQHPDWSRNATACTNQWKRLKALWKQVTKGDSASGGATVIKPAKTDATTTTCRGTPPSAKRRINETATMAAAQLLADTLTRCSEEGVSQITGVIREWMASQQSQTSRSLHFSRGRAGGDNAWPDADNATLSDEVEEWRC